VDPNATLDEIRTIIYEMEIDAVPDHWAAHDKLVTAVFNLDMWLSKGGFLPKSWQPKEN
jgi:hypothetical protein